MEWSLVASSLGASVAGGLFLAAGLNARQAPTDEGARQASTAFALWWLGVAAYAVGGASQDMLAAVGLTPIGVFVALRYLQIVALCIGLWGLMYYVAFVLTGRRSWMVPLAGFYALYYGGLLFLLTRAVPAAVEAHPWRSALVYASPTLGTASVAVLLAIPPLVAALTYLAIYAYARAPAQRVRVLLVGGSTLLWSVALFLREHDWSALTPALLGVLAGISVSWAYEPPAWLRARESADAAA